MFNSRHPMKSAQSFIEYIQLNICNAILSEKGTMNLIQFHTIHMVLTRNLYKSIIPLEHSLAQDIINSNDRFGSPLILQI